MATGRPAVAGGLRGGVTARDWTWVVHLREYVAAKWFGALGIFRRTAARMHSLRTHAALEADIVRTRSGGLQWIQKRCVHAC